MTDGVWTRSGSETGLCFKQLQPGDLVQTQPFPSDGQPAVTSGSCGEAITSTLIDLAADLQSSFMFINASCTISVQHNIHIHTASLHHLETL